jgi:hypothetical protein
MTMPSLTFLDKTSILIPRSKAFRTRPRYCLPFLCQDKGWRNSAFHEPVSVVAYARLHIVYKSPSRQIKSMRNNSQYTLRILATGGFDLAAFRDVEQLGKALDLFDHYRHPGFNELSVAGEGLGIRVVLDWPLLAPEGLWTDFSAPRPRPPEAPNRPRRRSLQELQQRQIPTHPWVPVGPRASS